MISYFGGFCDKALEIIVLVLMVVGILIIEAYSFSARLIKRLRGLV